MIYEMLKYNKVIKYKFVSSEKTKLQYILEATKQIRMMNILCVSLK